MPKKAGTRTNSERPAARVAGKVAGEPPTPRKRAARAGAPKGNKNAVKHGLNRAKTPRGGPTVGDEHDRAAVREYRRLAFPKDHPSRRTWIDLEAGTRRLKHRLDQRGWTTASGDAKDTTRLYFDLLDRREKLTDAIRGDMAGDSPSVEMVYRVVIPGVEYDDDGAITPDYLRYAEALSESQRNPSRPCLLCGTPTVGRKPTPDATGGLEAEARTAKGSEDVGALEAVTGRQDAPSAASKPAPSSPAAAERFGGGGDGRRDWRKERF